MKKSPEVYGTVTIGQRGQVVIPMKARKALKIKPGDKLIVTASPPGKKDIISLIPVDHISDFLSRFEGHLAALKKELSRHGR